MGHAMNQQILAMLPPRLYLKLKHWDFRRSHGEQYRELQARRSLATDSDYSYKPFDDRKAIFVHIPKCAGVAINRALFGNLAGGHTTLDEYLNAFEPRCIAEYFKFTVVRNPWDRLVSAYFFLQGGGMEQKDRTGFKKEFDHRMEFKDFVKSWLNRTNIWRWHHFRPQYHYMLEKRGKVHLDYVAFLENMEADFAFIANRIGVDCILKKSNNADHASYVDYYDEQTRDLVAEVYAEDIRLLGYSFDNSSLGEQLASRDRGKIYTLQSRPAPVPYARD